MEETDRLTGRKTLGKSSKAFLDFLQSLRRFLCLVVGRIILRFSCAFTLMLDGKLSYSIQQIKHSFLKES
jgi:hypothetical protein